MKLSQKEFMEVIQQEMKKRTGYEILVEERTKQKEGISFLLVEQRGEKRLPLVSLDCLYEAYQMGRSLEQVIELILFFCQQQMVWEKLKACCLDYEKAKQNIFYKLVNRAKQQAFLEELPNEPFLDLVKVYGVVEEGSDRRVMMTIRYEQLKKWGISEEELKQQAEMNMRQKFPVQVKPILEAIQEGMPPEAMEQGLEIDPMVWKEWEREKETSLLFVLSNTRNFYGAAVITYEGLLQEIAKRWGCDFVILPSSVHEVILTPVQEDVELSELVEMVKEINATEVREEDVLSNHVYLYEREKGTLVLI